MAGEVLGNFTLSEHRSRHITSELLVQIQAAKHLFITIIHSLSDIEDAVDIRLITSRLYHHVLEVRKILISWRLHRICYTGCQSSERQQMSRIP